MASKEGIALERLGAFSLEDQDMGVRLCRDFGVEVRVLAKRTLISVI